MTRKADATAPKEFRKRTASRRQPAHAGPTHPRSVPIIAPTDPADAEFDQPFAEGARDEIDPELRQRMISQAAYALYAGRDYADGYDLDDWLEAEAAVDHLRR
jgi:hypothetical protein